MAFTYKHFFACLFMVLFSFTLPAYSQSGTTVKVKSGTGFFVTPRHVVTNEHVISGCQKIVVRGAVEPTYATLIATDSTMDLALLKTEKASPRTAYLRSNTGLKTGDKLNVIGYPNDHGRTGQYLLKQATVTDPNFIYNGIPSIQFTNAVDHGNSGGPLLDYAGNVIGVVVAKLSYYKRDTNNNAATEPYQIRGIAIGLSILRAFLQRYDVFIIETSSYDIFSDPRPDERAKEYTVNVLCVEGMAQ